MRKIIVSIFLVLTFLCSPAMSETAAEWFDRANALSDEAGGKCTDPKKAIVYLNNAVKLKPDYVEAYNNRGLAYFNLGQYQRAIEDYNKALSLKPDFAKAYYNRGSAYRHLGKHQRAIEDYDNALRLKPDFADAYYNRGAAYDDFGQYQRAIEDYNEALRLKPDYVEAYNNRGVTYLLQDNNELGCRDAQKACALGDCKLLDLVKSKGLCP
jgi:tetratricopeptide (TPR) repeat protein